MKKFNILAAATTAVLLTGCTEYLTRSDTLSVHSGDAVARNLSNQMVDPWPPYVENTDIETSGTRQADVRKIYRNKHAPEEETGGQTITLVPTASTDGG